MVHLLDNKKIVTIDVENTFTKIGHRYDPSPFHSSNRLITVGVFCHTTDTMYYGKATDKAFLDLVYPVIAGADVYVGHNIRHDIEWLLETNFPVNRNARLWCTQVAEYLLQRGVKAPLSLDACVQRRGLGKKSTFLEEAIEAGLNVDQVEYEGLAIYGKLDITLTKSLFEAQVKDYLASSGLIPTLEMTQDMTWVVINLEIAGIFIDTDALAKVREEYQKEFDALTTKLQDMITICWGAKPVNINSDEQLSNVIYSREVIDKSIWASTFNLYKNARGKPERRPNISGADFYRRIRDLTKITVRYEVQSCASCRETGRFHRVRKDGSPFKKASRCSSCGGTGFIYTVPRSGVSSTDRLLPLIERYSNEESRSSYLKYAANSRAGLGLLPLDDVYLITEGGLSTDKDCLQLLIARERRNGNHFAVEFCSSILRRNAIKTYISTFCDGISAALRLSESEIHVSRILLHTRFNQTVVSTGRLSSSNPNFHNQPRGNTFPVRRVVTSRFKHGVVSDADYAQLEFRVAGELSGDTQIFQDVADRVDVHKFTSTVLSDAGQETDRQGAKPHTFKPLYGGTSGTDAEQTYYRAFLLKYKGMKAAHDKWQDEAIQHGIITLPSGREYHFPNCRRLRNGQASFATQIKNWPVQGFATADIVPIAAIRLDRLLRSRQARSVFCLTVHDSLTVDTHPDEKQLVIDLFKEAMCDIHNEIYYRYGYKMRIDLEIEIKQGPNWLDAKEVARDSTANWPKAYS